MGYMSKYIHEHVREVIGSKGKRINFVVLDTTLPKSKINNEI